MDLVFPHKSRMWYALALCHTAFLSKYISMTMPRVTVWLVLLLATVTVSLETSPDRDQDPEFDSATSPGAGHMKPLGWHRPPEPEVDWMALAPEPEKFFHDYVRKGRPLLMKGAARNMTAFQLWTDDYLRDKYGELEVEVEEGKKENRSRGLWNMKMTEFLDEYQHGDIYMVSSVPPEMAGEVGLLRCMLCGGFTDNLQDAVLWFSSGGTKSVLHYDAVDNINCVLDGWKEFFLVDKGVTDDAFIDHPEGSFSSVDVDHVDMHKYPGLGRVPWYNVTMEPGDCFFIPYRWFHQVRSSSGRNLATNIWFVHFVRFNSKDCHLQGKLPEYLPLGKFDLVSDFEQLRGEIANFIDELQEPVFKLEDVQKLASSFEIPIEESLTMFRILDEDSDEAVSLDEVYSCDMTEMLERIPGLVRTDSSRDLSQHNHDEL